MERLLTALGVAFVICLMVGPFVIPMLRIFKFGQNIREEGPQAHLKKAGTPTMGGVIFLAGIVGSSLLVSERPFSLEAATLLLSVVGYGFIGFLDDYIKIVKKRSLGLRAYQKLLGQLLLTVLLLWISVHYLGRGTSVDIPFTGYSLQLGWWYFPFAILLILFVNNAVNLTDGLDGLAAGNMLITMMAYTAIAIMSETQILGLITAHTYDLGVFSMAIAGGCLGFLWFNRHPARVFMGDTGSLALGGALVALAVLSKTELLLLIIGGVYIIEALSVVIQVISFQTTGKRVFKMAPLHHHFELIGWSENKVVCAFWLVNFLLGAVGVFTYSGGLR